MACGIFAISEYLIYYSSEVKQYSSDVFFALLILVLFQKVQSKRFSMASIISMSVIGGLGIWFSQPIIFVLAACGILGMFCSFKKGDKSDLVSWIFISSIWLISFTAYYNLFLQKSFQGNVMGAFHSHFLPFPPANLEELKWLLTKFFVMFIHPCGLALSGIAVICFLIGAESFYRKNPKHFWMLILPFLITLLASAFKKYPFQNRLIMFLIPNMVVLISEGCDTIREKTSQSIPVLWILTCILLIIHPLKDATKAMLLGKPKEENKHVLAYLQKNIQPSDLIYVYYGAKPTFNYYAKRFKLDQFRTVHGIEYQKDWKDYVHDLRQLRGKGRVWIVFAHIWKQYGVNEDLFYLYNLDQLGNQLDRFKAFDASVYLYNLP
jgi:hypothetical protein